MFLVPPDWVNPPLSVTFNRNFVPGCAVNAVPLRLRFACPAQTSLELPGIPDSQRGIIKRDRSL